MLVHHYVIINAAVLWEQVLATNDQTNPDREELGRYAETPIIYLSGDTKSLPVHVKHALFCLIKHIVY